MSQLGDNQRLEKRNKRGLAFHWNEQSSLLHIHLCHLITIVSFVSSYTFVSSYLIHLITKLNNKNVILEK